MLTILKYWKYIKYVLIAVCILLLLNVFSFVFLYWKLIAILVLVYFGYKFFTSK